MKRIILLSVCLYILTFGGIPVYPQDVSFGKNKVIVNHHKWIIAETEHFQIYHYPEESHFIPKISKILEETYKKITSELDFTIEEKTPFFFYLSHNHFEQNNIADVDEGVGGFSEPYKNRFVIPLTGSDKELEHVIAHEFTHIVNFHIWYSGFWKSAALMKFVFYPLWVSEGLSEYLSKDWETYDHMVVRDATISDKLIPLEKLHSFNHLLPHQVYLAYQEGHSAISYLAEQYGQDKVTALIKNFRESLDTSSVFFRTIGIDFYKFDKNWQKYVKEKYAQQVEGRKEPEIYGKKLTEGVEFNTNPVFSPDGKKIAFISDRNAYNDIFVMDTTGENQKSILKSHIGKKVDVVHSDGHALSWSSDGKKIAFAGERKQRDYLYVINLAKERLKKINLPLEVLSSPCFSPNEDKIVFVGTKGGIKDIYLVGANGENLVNLTCDEFCDDYPVFSPDGKRIVYVSERDKQKDLFLLDLEKQELIRLTATPNDELHPAWVPDGESILFVADYEGIYDIYRLDIAPLGDKDTEPELPIFQLTSIKVGLLTPEVSPDGSFITFASYRNNEINIHCGEFPLEGLYARRVKPEKVEAPTVTGLPSGCSLPKIAASPTPVTKIYPYKFRASTDLFFPFLFYSTTEGLYTAGYWQVSDMLGDHGLSAYLEYASTYDWLTYQIAYFYQRWRPSFGLFAYGKTRRESGEEVEKKSTRGEGIVVRYPLDRYRRVEWGLVTEKEREWNSISAENRENGTFISLVRDTTRGKVVDIMNGSRVNLTVYQAFKWLGGDFDYRDYILDGRKYYTLSERNILAMRVLGMVSKGPDKERFRLGGEYKLRGVSSEAFVGTKLALANIEWRFMIFPEINWRFPLLWPELYLKSLQLVMFTDTGTVWNRAQEIQGISDIKNTIGLGLRINTFLLQMFPLTFRLDYGWRTDKFTGKFYFSLGPAF